MTTETFIGIAASVLTAVSMLPQLYKVIKEKKAENISYTMLIVLIAGLGVWVYYGILKEDVILIISNSFSVFVNLVLLCAAIKFKS